MNIYCYCVCCGTDVWFQFQICNSSHINQSIEVYIYLTQRCAKYNLLGYRETASHSEMFCLWRDVTQIVSSIYQFRKRS